MMSTYRADYETMCKARLHPILDNDDVSVHKHFGDHGQPSQPSHPSTPTVDQAVQISEVATSFTTVFKNIIDSVETDTSLNEGRNCNEKEKAGC